MTVNHKLEKIIHASKQASKQVIKQASKQACKQASKSRKLGSAHAGMQGSAFVSNSK